MKIYNVKMVKTEMAGGPSKLCRNKNLSDSFKLTPRPMLGGLDNNSFLKKQIGGTHHASALRLVWKNPKGFLILTKFRGSSSHFRFDYFYIVDFHSALTSQVSVPKSEV